MRQNGQPKQLSEPELEMLDEMQTLHSMKLTFMRSGTQKK